jgi:hypothetical protein
MPAMEDVALKAVRDFLKNNWYLATELALHEEHTRLSTDTFKTYLLSRTLLLLFLL